MLEVNEGNLFKIKTNCLSHFFSSDKYCWYLWLNSSSGDKAFVWGERRGWTKLPRCASSPLFFHIISLLRDYPRYLEGSWFPKTISSLPGAVTCCCKGVGTAVKSAQFPYAKFSVRKINYFARITRVNFRNFSFFFFRW